jgi:hypothetical protein
MVVAQEPAEALAAAQVTAHWHDEFGVYQRVADSLVIPLARD